MRLLRLRAALRDFLRRWGIQCSIVVVVFSAGSNAPFAIALALASGLAWPLHRAAELAWPLPLVVALYAVVGALPVACSRALWWPRGWALSERALPLPTATLRRSDSLLSLIVMTPWQIALALGVVGVAVADHANGRPLAAWSLTGAWLLSAAGSFALSVRWMRRVRRVEGTTRETRPIDGRIAANGPQAFRPLGFRRAVVLLPILRGRALRTTVGLSAGLSATMIGATAFAWSPLPVGWSLAGLAGAALSSTSFLRAASIRDLQPLWRANRALPLDHRSCERTRIAVVLLPTIAALVSATSALTAFVAVFRWKAVAAYVVALATACLVEALTPPAMQPHDHAARWILMLAIAIACASEVLPS